MIHSEQTESMLAAGDLVIYANDHFQFFRQTFQFFICGNWDTLTCSSLFANRTTCSVECNLSSDSPGVGRRRRTSVKRTSR